MDVVDINIRYINDSVKAPIWAALLKRTKQKGQCLVMANGVMQLKIPTGNYISGAFHGKKIAYALEHDLDAIGCMEIPKNVCDTPGCVLPEHLKLSELHTSIPVELRCLYTDTGYSAKWHQLLHNALVDASGCLLWTGGKNCYGYGVASWKSKTWTTHRLSHLFSRALNPIPDTDSEGRKLVVRHLCDVKLCFHPDHLKIGTHAENSEDYANTGRRGERHNSTDEVVVRAILDDLKHMDKLSGSISAIARKHGVSRTVVSRIVNGKTHGAISGIRDGANSLNAKAREQRINPLTPSDIDLLADRVLKKCHMVGDCMIYRGANQAGYGTIKYRSKLLFAHDIVCRCKMRADKPPGVVTRHSCHNRLCCNPSHLEWGSVSENAVDTVKTGKNDLICKLSSEDVQIIKRLLLDGYQVDGVRKHFNVSQTCVYAIKRGKTWVHVDPAETIPDNLKSLPMASKRLTPEELSEIQELLAQGISQKDIAKQFQMAQNTISTVAKKLSKLSTS
jgi:transcriptional regulator with XRE-family HTH domain